MLPLLLYKKLPLRLYKMQNLVPKKVVPTSWIYLLNSHSVIHYRYMPCSVV